MLKCENLPSTNSTISGAQYNFSKTSTPQRPFEAGSNYAVHTSINEMVSLGDKAISLHILQPPTATRGGCSVLVKTQSAKICLNLNFQGGGMGYSVLVKTESAKICLNFNWGGVLY